VKKTFVLLASLLAAVSFAQIQRGEPLKRSGLLGVQSAPSADGKGVRVVRALPGGTGESLKLAAEDVILTINGSSVSNPQQLVGAVRTLKEGDAIRIVYLRGGKEATAEGKMLARPKQVEDGLDVIYDQVVSMGKRIRVIVTKPKAAGRHPVFFYIGGIGAYSLDGSFSSLFPAFGKVLEPIAKAGYVTVRIDKPGQGDSEGPIYRELGFGVEQDAYLQALRLTKTYDFVDPQRIAIFGHSMGGTFGPLVAAQEPVKTVIVLGTLYKTFGEYMLENTRRQAEMGGAAPDALDQGLRDMVRAYNGLFNEGLSPRQLQEKYPDLRQWVQENMPDLETYSGVGVGFWRELSQVNIAKAWNGVSGDALAIYCENDFLCGQDDHERIAKAMNAKRAGSGEFVLLKGSDHLLRKTSSPLNSLQTWGQPGEFNPNVIETLLDYLKRKLS
jgi:pimeloyl-ACP methyl ester carboxylesterase